MDGAESSKYSTVSKKNTKVDVNEQMDNLMTSAFGNDVNLMRNQPAIDAEYIKKQFLKENGLEHIDVELHAYLSVNTLRETITEVLYPIMSKARGESEFAKGLAE